MNPHGDVTGSGVVPRRSSLCSSAPHPLGRRPIPRRIGRANDPGRAGRGTARWRWKLEADEAGWGPAQADELIAQLPAGTRSGWARCGVSARSGSTSTANATTTNAPSRPRVDRRPAALGSDGACDDVHRHRRRRGRWRDASAGIHRRHPRAARQPGPHLRARLPSPTATAGRYTSRELAEVERRFAAAVTRPTDGPAPSMQRSSPRRWRGGRRSVRTRPSRSSGCAPPVGVVAVLIGPAGTGKTFTLDTVRNAYEQAGWRVIGAGPSARAAQELTGGPVSRRAPCMPWSPTCTGGGGDRRAHPGRDRRSRDGRHRILEQVVTTIATGAAGSCWSAIST